MDRLENDCPPDSFKKMMNYAKKHNMNMPLNSGTDANTHNTYWNSRLTDKLESTVVRGNSLLSYIAKDKLFVENAGNTPTFDNSRCTNFIDLTLTNAKVHDPMDQWQVVKKIWHKLFIS